MRFRLAWLLLLAIVQPALARLPRSQVAVVQDSDGYCNGRSGPGTDFKVKLRLANGEHVMLTKWPQPFDREQLKRPFFQDQLRKLCKEPGRIFEWRWAITLQRNPSEEELRAGDWSYLHSSRLKVVRDDAVSWGWIIDPDGYLNVRSRPDSAAEVVGKINLTACFIVLDQPAYDKLNFSSAGLMVKAAPWTRVITRDGVVGWARSTRIRLHDGRNWQFDGPIPYVL